MAYSRIDALKVMSALEGVIDCLEEPMIAWDNEGRKDVASRVSVPILSDESTFTVADVYHQIQLGAIGEVDIKIPRTGFTLSTKIVHLAECANIPVQVSLQAETDFGNAACLQFASAYEQISLPCEFSYYVDDIGDNLLKSPLVIRDGKMLLPGGPGMGVKPDWEKVEKYAISI
ncbi:enolase C-terminal domain-like protein [Breoghania sp.]|uniref:enolase C-terminal domain-like protein n=1 Tax=Breoghania sp. TaxID=2065378 RepID=UPI0026254D85|nr:enolase C-terminal domain-like protein [Breoghania sp.]MDJ0931700.1 enolase C-terminal domain-like protein [Breoghania sp.]